MNESPHEKVAMALGLLKSMIDGGEDWTPQSIAVYEAAHNSLEEANMEITRLRAEHDTLVERLRGIDRWRIAGGRSAIYRQPYPDKPQHYEWLHTGEVIRAADLERVLNAPPGNTPRG